jgi:hypothetical protein
MPLAQGGAAARRSAPRRSPDRAAWRARWRARGPADRGLRRRRSLGDVAKVEDIPTRLPCRGQEPLNRRLFSVIAINAENKKIFPISGAFVCNNFHPRPVQGERRPRPLQPRITAGSGTRNRRSSCPASCRASTSCHPQRKSWMAGTSPAMTRCRFNRGPRPALHCARHDHASLPQRAAGTTDAG